MSNQPVSSDSDRSQGMTLIELLIVMAVMALLLSIAVASYKHYMLRVHRTEAIRSLLQAAMCQERVYAEAGNYDTGLCRPVSGLNHYRLAYQSSQPGGLGYVLVAIPEGGQLADPCGSLSLDNTGARGISGKKLSSAKCWNGR